MRVGDYLIMFQKTLEIVYGKSFKIKKYTRRNQKGESGQPVRPVGLAGLGITNGKTLNISRSHHKKRF